MDAMLDRKELTETTGAAIRFYRDRVGLSQTALAKVAGVSRVTINRLEQGLQLPDFGIICAIADALGVSVSELRQPEKFRKN